MSRTFKDAPNQVLIARRDARGKRRTHPTRLAQYHQPQTGATVTYLLSGPSSPRHSEDPDGVYYMHERTAVRTSLARVHATVHNGLHDDLDDSDVEVRPMRRGLWGGGCSC